MNFSASCLASTSRPSDIAIIGMSCFYPRAGSLRGFWDNILAKVDAVTEVPASHWDWRLYYDPDPRARDKIYSKWGGFLEDVLFDPLVFGMPPSTIPSIEPLQLILLEGVRQALAHAGYADKPFDRERTSAILGIGGGGLPVSVSYGLRACMPLFDSVPGMAESSGSMMTKLATILPEWTEDSFPGILNNVAAGRVANRFNFGGANFAIDAACASSLAALQLGVNELQMGTSEVSVVMGADAVQTPYAYMAFSKTHALSGKGKCRPFDEAADGIVLSEGVGVVVLKRLADAQRDGDKIWAVIKGVGASSDGRDKGLTAPRAEGQLRALRRAYQVAGVSPAQVGLVEAHGTGTVVGDRTEAQALKEMFVESGAAEASRAVGSVKSLIGHAKCAAGMAGLIKTVLALHHKVLPPTQVEKPNSKAGLDHGPLFLNAEARPWVQGNDQLRRAGVSAFGFGGTNFHVVLEESQDDAGHNPLPTWPAELLVWRRPTRQNLIEELQRTQQVLAHGAKPSLADFALSLALDFVSAPRRTALQSRPDGSGEPSCKASDLPTVAFVATSLDDCRDKLAVALKSLQGPDRSFNDPRGVWFAENPAELGGKVAMLFPGQGSQYVNMLAQTAIAFPQAREVFDRADQTVRGRLEWPLSRFIFPPSAFTPEQEQHHRQELTRTEVAQPAVGVASLALWRLLHDTLGIQPDFLAGHSYGEYAALCAAGALSEDALLQVSHRRGAIIHQVTAQMPGAMAAIEAGAAAVAEHLREAIEPVQLANLNSPNQTVISGSEEGIVSALETLKKKGVRGQRLAVACAFHSPLVGPAQQRLAEALREFDFAAAKTPVYSNVTAAPYPGEPAQMVDLLSKHLTSPVRFQEQIESLYQAGARVFVEVGPQGVLTGLVGQVLKERPHLALASDSKAKPGLVSLQQLLGQLIVHGVPVRLEALHAHRGLQAFDLAQLDKQTGQPRTTPTTCVANSVRTKLINAPEPRLIGQRPPPEQTTPRAPSMSKPVPVPEPIAQRMTAREPAPAAAPPARETRPHALPPAPAPVAAPADEAAQVMLRFQELMARFLDTQKSIMLTYLQGGAVSLPSAPPLTAFVPPLAPAVNGNGHGNGHANGHSKPKPAAPPMPAQVATPPAPAAVTPPVETAEAAAPANAAAPVAPSTGKRKPTMDRDAILAKLLDLISQRTGYPREMLELDLDLEADLGIDSIKRVEILGGLAESIDGIDMTANVEMEKLTSIRTLRGIVDVLDQLQTQSAPKVAEVAAPALPAAAASVRVEPSPRAGEIQRLTVKLIDAPLPDQPLLLNFAGPLLITDDGNGVARALADRLGDLGQSAVLLRMKRGHNNGSAADGFSADLTDPDSVAHVLERIRLEVGAVSGLVHLLPLGEPPAGEAEPDRARREVKSLYLLARGLEEGLRQQGKDGDAVLLAGTKLGGRLGVGSEPLPTDFFAGQGGILGFTKCLAHEWPEVLVRAVDLDGARPTGELADAILTEMGDGDGPLEVGVAGTRRVTTLTMPAPLTESAPAIAVGPGSTILVTGGARGITAAVAHELARRYQPRLILVGRSPLPGDESADTAGLTGQAEIKAALMAHWQRLATYAPAQVEQAYQRLLIDREIRNNLARIRQAGATVEYRSVDVRKEDEMAALLAEIEASFGGLDGVIHGAGVIEDRLLRDKTPESFERVFGTKVDSALILARHLTTDRLKFLVLFSSIAGRYGNRGQSDYAAANEALAKLAVDCNQRWSGRVVSMAWGPWSGLGMVADLEKHLVARGLKLISPEEGACFVLDELRLGPREDAEVVIAGGSEQMAKPTRPAKTAGRQPETVSS